jgi:RTX calcium-binding nonapeptide repeat (4 copies)
VSYEFSEARVIIDLDLQSGERQMGGSDPRSESIGDLLRNIENVLGSDHGDIIMGSDGANEFEGLGGNDTLTGGLGGDMFTFFGATGNDRIEDFKLDAHYLRLDLSEWDSDGDGLAGNLDGNGNLVLAAEVGQSTITLVGLTMDHLAALQDRLVGFI